MVLKSFFYFSLLSLITKSAGTPVENAFKVINADDNEPEQWVKVESSATSFHPQDNQLLDEKLRGKSKTVTFPSAMRFQTTVVPAIELINKERMNRFMEHFTSYVNRHYQTVAGRIAAEWLLDQVQESIDASQYATVGKVEAKFWKHDHIGDPTWVQPSVIARVQGSDPVLSQEVVIIGAHLDSIIDSNTSSSSSRAEGANDNASGSVVLLETLRILLQTKFIPKRSVEFQWYAAEEVGLKGSHDIAETYYNTDVNVFAMLNFDMSSYFEGQKTIAIILDEEYTNPELNNFLNKTITEYCDYGLSEMRCGVACTDHASFTEFGFPAASPVEPIINGVRHTINDTMDIVNLELLTEFVKVGIGYVVELSEIGEPFKSSGVRLSNLVNYMAPLSLIIQLFLHRRY